MEVRVEPSGAASSLSQEELRDRVELHVARTFVDRPDLRIAVELLHRILLGVAVAPEQLDCERRHPLSHLRAQELRHRRFFRIRLPRVLEPSGVVDHETCCLQLRRRLRELKLDALELCNSTSRSRSSRASSFS